MPVFHCATSWRIDAVALRRACRVRSGRDGEAAKGWPNRRSLAGSACARQADHRDQRRDKPCSTPLVRGVVEKAKNPIHADQFHVGQGSQRQSSAQIEQGIPAAGRRDRGRDRPLYASHFTEAELKQILAFYQSPVGQQDAHRRAAGRSIESMANAGSLGRQSVPIEVIEQIPRRDEEARTRPADSMSRITMSICSSSAAARAACAPRASPRSTAPASCWPRNIASAAPA